MTRREPFTNADIAERSTWPESQAGLRGPSSYDELGVLNHKQRGELVRLARVEAAREKPFIDEVACCINGYRLRKRRHAQESPAAVALQMRRIIGMVEAYAHEARELYGIGGLKPPLPTADWFERANEQVRQKERWIKGHRSSTLTEPLILHAWALQKLAGAYSNHQLRELLVAKNVLSPWTVMLVVGSKLGSEQCIPFRVGKQTR